MTLVNPNWLLSGFFSHLHENKAVFTATLVLCGLAEAVIKRTSPTDHSARLKVNDYVMKKRTTFLSSSPKKFQYKTVPNAYQITTKIATNVYRLKSIIDEQEIVLPGDQLVKMRFHDKNSLRQLVQEMRTLMAVGDQKTSPMTTRSRIRMEKTARTHPKPKAKPLEGAMQKTKKKKKEKRSDPSPTPSVPPAKRQSERLKSKA